MREEARRTYLCLKEFRIDDCLLHLYPINSSIFQITQCTVLLGNHKKALVMMRYHVTLCVEPRISALVGRQSCTNPDPW